MINNLKGKDMRKYIHITQAEKEGPLRVSLATDSIDFIRELKEYNKYAGAESAICTRGGSYLVVKETLEEIETLLSR